MTARPFLNIAHRGARAFAPENTTASIRMAKRQGANAVEIDVQMSRDDELIVFHDDDVTRCTDGIDKYPLHTDYAVSAFTWDELQVLDVGQWYVRELRKPPRHRDPYLRDLRQEELDRWVTPADAEEYESGSVRIPHLKNAIQVALEDGLVVVLDLKTLPRRYPSIAIKTLELVEALAAHHAVLITSFDHVLLAEIREQNRTVATGVLTAERLHHPLEYVRALDADAYEPACSADTDVVRRGISPDEIDTQLIGELSAAGIMVNVWTENSDSRMQVLLNAGVTGIFTDYPNRLAAVLETIGRVAPAHPRLRCR
jgi:glycerophosphoryl diester phosphodiesterase